MRQELCDVEVALRRSKVKDYYKIQGMCTVGFFCGTVLTWHEIGRAHV